MVKGVLFVLALQAPLAVPALFVPVRSVRIALVVVLFGLTCMLVMVLGGATVRAGLVTARPFLCHPGCTDNFLAVADAVKGAVNRGMAAQLSTSLWLVVLALVPLRRPEMRTSGRLQTPDPDGGAEGRAL